MANKLTIFYSPKCIEYRSPGHPESPERVINSYEFLKKKGYEFVSSSSCTKDDILLVHTKVHLNRVENGNFYDADTPSLSGIYEYARLSAGAAIKAAELVEKNLVTFSLMRPPGHHAGKESIEGFCYFNNIAIAVEKVISEKKYNRVAIVDIDCHHGNGTEEIFLGIKDILYVSLHQIGIYPGTGHRSYQNCLNFPLQASMNSREYLINFQEAIEEVKKFKPDLIAVSAGFDTYKKDPLCSLQLEVGSYKTIGEKLSQLNLPLFAVLEGGYSQDLPYCINSFLEGLK